LGLTQTALQRPRIGVFGGSFDPPHLAHASLLQTAVNELALDEMRVLPTGQAWHKNRTLSDAKHRLAMAELAFKKMPNVVVDDQEILRTGPSYTVDTLRSLAAVKPLADVYLMMGADQAAVLTTWRAWQEILQLATVCVADRGDTIRASGQFDAEELFPRRFIHLQMPALDISATQIRSRVAAAQPIDTLVSEPVARYIADHHLYLNP
jgi:nicotinate-nucleotide adenylyltransferase